MAADQPLRTISASASTDANADPNTIPNALLKNLSHKSGVRRTLIISRATGAVVQSSGYDSIDTSLPDPLQSHTRSTSSEINSVSELRNSASENRGAIQPRPSAALNGNETQPEPELQDQQTKSREQIDAELVISHVEASTRLVQALGEARDEMELMRVRSRRYEFMIVPGLCPLFFPPFTFVFALFYSSTMSLSFISCHMRLVMVYIDSFHRLHWFVSFLAG